MAEYPVPVTDTLLQEITQKIVEGFDPEKVILFGSHASDTPHMDSDIDLLVIMEAHGSAIQRAVELTGPTGRALCAWRRNRSRKPSN